MPRKTRAIVSFLMITGVAVHISVASPPQAASCGACHGIAGLGNAAAGFPALAGLSQAYLEQQLYSFKHGTRANAIMSGIATGLNGTDRKVLAAYYAGLPVPVQPEPAHVPTGVGAAIALNGAWHQSMSGLPSCQSCHGPDGVGVGAMFPRLAGQPAQYLSAQLKDWQAGSRKNDPLHLMQNVAHKLSAAQITAVSDYYAALSANPPPALKPKGDQ